MLNAEVALLCAPTISTLAPNVVDQVLQVLGSVEVIAT